MFNSTLSQWGEISNINLVRDKDTGKSKGFCFICYENQRSTILAVDNFNGMTLCNRPVRVDHVEEYKVPKVYTSMLIFYISVIYNIFAKKNKNLEKFVMINNFNFVFIH